MLLIDKAIEYLHRHGWSQGSYENEIGEVCLSRALRKAHQELYGKGSDDSELRRARQAVMRQIHRLHRRTRWGDKTMGSIPDFNDDPRTEFSDVLDVLKLAGEDADLRAEKEKT
jgi:hypothetical protein